MNQLANELLIAARAKNIRVVTAESCTGGLIAAALTDIAGSSDVFEGGFVTYANEAKISMLSVPEALIVEHGAVSEPVALAMAQGAINHSRATLSVAVTGIAGPGGGSEAKPVGLVFIAVALKDKEPHATKYLFSGSRRSIREKAVDAALQMMLDTCNSRHCEE